MNKTRENPSDSIVFYNRQNVLRINNGFYFLQLHKNCTFQENVKPSSRSIFHQNRNFFQPNINIYDRKYHTHVFGYLRTYIIRVSDRFVNLEQVVARLQKTLEGNYYFEHFKKGDVSRGIAKTIEMKSTDAVLYPIRRSNIEKNGPKQKILKNP